MKILIVDDETDICYLLSRILKMRNNNVETTFVNTLSEATETLKHEDPTLMFLDNHLPDGTGMNYIEFVKETHPEIKIIMITAHDSPSDRKSALTYGADAFIGKPFSRDLIHKTVEQFIN